MAIKTFYLLNSAGVSPGFYGNLQDGGSAPAAALSAFGWSTGKLASAYWKGRVGAIARTAEAQGSSWLAGAAPFAGTGTGANASGDSFRTTAPLSGAFAAGNWTFNFGVRTGAAGGAGRMRCQIWAGPNADGSGARKIGGVNIGSTVTLAAISTTYNSTVAVNPGAVTLLNEYLFFAVEWNLTTAGGSNSCTVQFYQSAGSIVTPDFVLTIVGALDSDEAPDDATMTGALSWPELTGTLADQEDPDTADMTGEVLSPITGTMADVEDPDIADFTGTAALRWSRSPARSTRTRPPTPPTASDWSACWARSTAPRVPTTPP